MKSLQSINKMETMQMNLYNRPEGLPLTTLEEFQIFQADADRLLILVSLLFNN